MKRSSFLKFSISLGSVLYAPIATYAHYMREKKGFKVGAGKDRNDKSISIFDGDTFYTKVSGKDTDGDLYVFESTRSKEGGPILHTHYARSARHTAYVR
ncbi:MAG: hypothetical protein JNK79_12835 [Chitinophagaceae bacterium]|nr:hypothetical protein [Chitinophagaceae bacterium]